MANTNLTAAVAADGLPLELLQPLDATHPLSTPASTGGPEQRLQISPDPGVGAELDLRPTRLLISKDGQIRSIWPVHLGGWQALGWQLLPAAVAEPLLAEQELAPGSPAQENNLPLPVDVVAGPAVADPVATNPSSTGEALLADELPNFQGMTKAEIVAFCSATYGVSLDGSMTKAELVAAAIALVQNPPEPQQDEADAESPLHPPGEGSALESDEVATDALVDGDLVDDGLDLPDDLL